MRKRDKVGISITIILFGLLFTLIHIRSFTIDSDSFFLIANGKYIVNNKAVPTINPWVVHKELEVIIQQWVCSVLNYLFYNNFGFAGLVILTVLSVCVFMIVIYGGTYKVFGKDLIKTVVVAFPIILFMIHRWGCTRPTLITACIMLCEYFALYSYFNNKKWFGLIVKIALISFVQINYHASMWIITILLILPYMAPSLEDMKNRKINFGNILKGAVLILTSFIASLFNPYGIKAVLYLFSSYSNAKGCEAIELQALTINSVGGLIVIISILMFAYLVYKKKVTKNLIYLYLGMLILAFQHERNLWFLIFPYIEMLSILYEECKNNINIKASISAVIVVVEIILLIANVYSVGNLCNGLDNKVDCVRYNVQSFEYLEDKENVRLLTTFRNGAGFVMNGYKVYYDARPELYGEEILDEYNRFVSDPSFDIDGFIEKYDFTHIALTNEYTLYREFKNNDKYTEVINTGQYYLFEVNN